MPIKSFVDKLTTEHVRGWSCDINNPSRLVRIEASVEGEAVGTALAESFRRDLLANKVGTGYHAFFLKFTRPLSTADLAKLALSAVEDSGDLKKITLPKVSESDDTGKEGFGNSLHAQVRRLLKSSSGFAKSPAYDTNGPLPIDLVRAADLNTLVSRSKEVAKYFERSGVSLEELHRAIERDTAPIPSSDIREGYARGRDFAYWLAGYSEYKLLSSLASKYDVGRGRFFDFGGSTGRLFRHFNYQDPNWEVWTSDFKFASFEYNVKNFNQRLRPFVNTAYPPLPLTDGFFNLITALSVFTHINEAESMWLLEMRRILAPNGIALITVLNEASWKVQDVAMRTSVAKFRPDLVGVTDLPDGKTVVEFRDDDPYNCNIFHKDEYIRNVWGRYFEICEILPNFLNKQSMVVCRRRD